MGFKRDFALLLRQLNRLLQARIVTEKDRYKGLTEAAKTWSPEARHMAHEKMFWAASLFVSFVTIVTAFGAIYYSHGAFVEAQEQAKEARRQADAAEQANRAWLSVEQPSYMRFDKEKNGVSVGMNAKIHNVGHTSALDVFVLTRVSTLPVIDYHLQSQYTFFHENLLLNIGQKAREEKIRQFEYFGSALLPEDSALKAAGAFIPQELKQDLSIKRFVFAVMVYYRTSAHSNIHITQRNYLLSVDSVFAGDWADNPNSKFSIIPLPYADYAD